MLLNNKYIGQLVHVFQTWFANNRHRKCPNNENALFTFSHMNTLIYVFIDQGIHKRKSKVARFEK